MKQVGKKSQNILFLDIDLLEISTAYHIWNMNIQSTKCSSGCSFSQITELFIWHPALGKWFNGQGPPKKKNLHEQAPVHKSWRLMSELMANPNGHLQVINVIHGCQLTSHLNNHSLWNTNQTASPWYTDYFIPLIRGFIRGHRQRQQGGGGGVSFRCILIAQ